MVVTCGSSSVPPRYSSRGDGTPAAGGGTLACGEGSTAAGRGGGAALAGMGGGALDVCASAAPVTAAIATARKRHAARKEFIARGLCMPQFYQTRLGEP